MGIAFNCEHCGKKIEAPDKAGGKWGKCPACHNRVYVPEPDAGEELKLAPIDESELEKQKRLMAETYRLTHDILLEREEPAGSVDISAKSTSISDEQLTTNIITYLRQMADGELDHAERLAASIVSAKGRALKILDELVTSEIPEPELADIPQQVLSGLIRNLRSRIK